MVLDLLWDTIFGGCILSLVIVGKVQNHEFGEAVEELSIAKCISWPEQTAGLLCMLCVVYLTSSPVVHGTYTLRKVFEPGQRMFILALSGLMRTEEDRDVFLLLPNQVSRPNKRSVRTKVSQTYTYIVLVGDDGKPLKSLQTNAGGVSALVVEDRAHETHTFCVIIMELNTIGFT